MENPPCRGVKRAVTNCGELGTTRHCCAPRGLIARSFEMRCTVPGPSDLATFKIPTPFVSCFRTFRSVALSIFGWPSFTLWATARLRPALTRWRIAGQRACPRKSAFCKRGSVNVPFAPKATEDRPQTVGRIQRSRGLLYCRDFPCAVEDRRIAFVRPVHSQHQDELACRCGEPV